MSLSPAIGKFESAVLENLDAAHNLARWLVRNDSDAQDVVQESCMKALRAFDSFRGQDFRPWFLAIVRNTSFTWLSRQKSPLGQQSAPTLDAATEIPADPHAYDPHLIAIRAADAQSLRSAISALPDQLREAIILREMQSLSYKEIAKITGVPIGTVMSRLARGRSQLQAILIQSDPPQGAK